MPMACGPVFHHPKMRILGKLGAAGILLESREGKHLRALQRYQAAPGPTSDPILHEHGENW